MITVPVKILLTCEVRAETRAEAWEQSERWLTLVPYLLLLSPLPVDIALSGRPRATRLRRRVVRRRHRSPKAGMKSSPVGGVTLSPAGTSA